jgi:membrane-associated HD superfamily phosphohydrolase
METPQFQLETKTEEQVKSLINTAFDSVNLINSIVSESFDAKKESTIKANVEHLNVMLSKDWFSKGLTTQQKTNINSSIAAGNNYKAQ